MIDGVHIGSSGMQTQRGEFTLPVGQGHTQVNIDYEIGQGVAEVKLVRDSTIYRMRDGHFVRNGLYAVVTADDDARRAPPIVVERVECTAGDASCPAVLLPFIEFCTGMGMMSADHGTRACTVHFLAGDDLWVIDWSFELNDSFSDTYDFSGVIKFSPHRPEP